MDSVLEHVGTISLLAAIEMGALIATDKYICPAELVKTRESWSTNVLCIPFAVVLFSSALLGSYDLHYTVESRFFGVSAASIFFQRLYCSHNIISTILLLREEVPLEEKLPMFVHHLVSCVAYMSGLFSGRLHFWACLAGCCEVTNVFLNVLLTTKHEESGVGANFKALLGERLFILNGLLLWFTFFMWRILLFPSWLVLFATDIRYMYTTGNYEQLVLPNGVHGHSMQTVTWFELILYPAIVVFLLVLSMMWFIRLTKGVLKELGYSGAGKKDKKIQ